MNELDSTILKSMDSKKTISSIEEPQEKQDIPRKGPLSFLSGAMTSGLFAWICLILSKKTVGYFMLHPQNYSSPIAQSAASGFKTLVIGMCFLSTFTFAFIGLGLLVVFVRSLFAVKDPLSD